MEAPTTARDAKHAGYNNSQTASRGRGRPPKQPGTHVRDVRLAADIHLRQLEEITGISRARWSLIENGKIFPEPRELAALSDALGVPYEQWRIRFVLEREEPSS